MISGLKERLRFGADKSGNAIRWGDCPKTPLAIRLFRNKPEQVGGA